MLCARRPSLVHSAAYRPIGAGTGAGFAGGAPLPGWLVVPPGLLAGCGADATPTEVAVLTVTAACPLTLPNVAVM